MLVFHEHCVNLHVDLSSKGFRILKNSSIDPDLKKPTEYDFTEAEAFKITKGKMQPLLLPECYVSTRFQYIEPSNVLPEYLGLFDSLVELLKGLYPHKIIDVLSNVTASDSYGIKYFATDFIDKLREFTTITSLLRVVFPYTNWFDHSIIRELVEACDCPEGVNLLNEFDSRIDVTLPITEYPIPGPSDLITPNESSSHTVMVIKCAESLASFSLKNIIAIKIKMMDKFNITKHSCNLLAVAGHSLAMLFWLIPKSVASVIINSILKHSSDLLQLGITEVAICPNFSFLTSNTYQIWTATYCSDSITLSKQVSLCNMSCLGQQ